jgi:hypothetical protein
MVVIALTSRSQSILLSLAEQRQMNVQECELNSWIARSIVDAKGVSSKRLSDGLFGFGRFKN